MYVFLNPYKGHLGSRRSLEKTENSSNIKFLHFFLFLVTILACLDPDPLTHLNTDPIRIRIRNTVLLGGLPLVCFSLWSQKPPYCAGCTYLYIGCQCCSTFAHRFLSVQDVHIGCECCSGSPIRLTANLCTTYMEFLTFVNCHMHKVHIFLEMKQG
jgi:hypothetical protein